MSRKAGEATSDVALSALNNDAAPDYAIFFRREYSRVLRTVYLITRERASAEDITQDAFFQLLRHWPRVATLDWPEAWVRRVAVRLAMRRVRRDALRSMLERQTSVVALCPGPDVNLAALVAQLPSPQRTAIVLHYYEDQPLDQVANLMECSVNTVKSHLHRGRKKLHGLLEASGGA